MSTETTALASSNTWTPTRRSSWKDRTCGAKTRDKASQPLMDEKQGPPTSSNPFPHSLASTPTPAAHSPDIEAQPTSSSSKAAAKRHRMGACAMLFCILLIWGVFLFGAAVLLDTLYPGAMKQKMAGMRAELGDTERAVRVLKSTVEGLVGYVGELRGGVGMVGAGDAGGELAVTGGM